MRRASDTGVETSRNATMVAGRGRNPLRPHRHLRRSAPADDLSRSPCCRSSSPRRPARNRIHRDSGIDDIRFEPKSSGTRIHYTANLPAGGGSDHRTAADRALPRDGAPGDGRDYCGLRVSIRTGLTPGGLWNSACLRVDDPRGSRASNLLQSRRRINGSRISSGGYAKQLSPSPPPSRPGCRVDPPGRQREQNDLRRSRAAQRVADGAFGAATLRGPTSCITPSGWANATMRTWWCRAD